MDAKKGLLLLAGLVGDAAAGLAGALAGGLAFAAAAVVQALGHVAGVESLDVLHKTVTPFIIGFLYCTRRAGGLSSQRQAHGQRVGGFGADMVRRFDVRAPGVDAAHAAHGRVQAQVGVRRGGQVLAVVGGFQLRRRVGQRRKRERRPGHGQLQRRGAPAAGGAVLQAHGVGVHVAAAVLRDQVRRDVRRFAVRAEHAAFVPVGVGFARKAGPADTAQRRGRREPHAKAGQLRQAGRAVVFGRQRQRATRRDGIPQHGERAGHGRGLEPAGHGHGARAFALHRHAGAWGLAVGRQPGRAAHREAAGFVVFGGCAPENGPRRAVQPFGPVGPQADRPAVDVGEQHAKALPVHAQRAVPVHELQVGRGGFGGVARGVFGRDVLRAGRRGRGVGGVVRGAGRRGRMPVAHLLHGGLFRAVRKDDAVGGKVIIRLPLAKIAAVAKGPAAQRVGAPQRLVHIIPDKAALILREFFAQADVALHAAEGVAHVVHVLAQDERLFRPAFEIGADVLGFGVHAALDVGRGLPCGVAAEQPRRRHALIVHQAAGVVFPEKAAHGQDVFARKALVAAAPQQHRRVVFVALEHRARAVQHAGPPFGAATGQVVGQRVAAAVLPAAVGLQVGLVDHIHAVFVAQVVPRRLVGVVAGAHGVDVVAAEGLHRFDHVGHADGAAVLGVPLVPVDAVEKDPAAVQAHDAVDHLKAAETGAVGHRLDGAAVRAAQRQRHGVQRRVLVAPGAHAGQRDGRGLPHHAALFPARRGQGERRFVQNRAAGRGHAAIDGAGFGAGGVRAGGLEPRGQRAGGVVRRQAGAQPQVFDVRARLCIEEHRAEDAGKAEEVLVLQPGGGGSLVHLDAQAVAGFVHKGGQVKVGRGEGILAVADELPVAPAVKRGLDALERDAHPPAAQRGREVELGHIAADGAILPGDPGRGQLLQGVPRVEGVDVLQLAVALRFDVAGHGDGTERRKVGVRRVKPGRARGGAGAPGKAPAAVKRLDRLLPVHIKAVVRVGGQAVDREDGRVFQPGERGGGNVRHKGASFFRGVYFGNAGGPAAAPRAFVCPYCKAFGARRQQGNGAFFKNFPALLFCFFFFARAACQARRRLL